MAYGACSVVSQRCEPCGLGQQSGLLRNCYSIFGPDTVRLLGYYKDTVGSGQCLVCSRGTFNPDAGTTPPTTILRFQYALSSADRGYAAPRWYQHRQLSAVPAACHDSARG
eukprot:890301-Rhodomonas_salina.3